MTKRGLLAIFFALEALVANTYHIFDLSFLVHFIFVFAMSSCFFFDT